MTTINQALGTQAARSTQPAAHEYPAETTRFALAATALSAWFVAGMYLDGWAHNNIDGLFETFLTPWHGVLYSGYFAVAILHFAALTFNVRRGYALTHGLPRGYWPSIVGIMLFGFGGGFDMFWHTTFGFEENVEAVLSPAHLLLAAGAFLFIAGPLRAAWVRPATPARPSWRQWFPAAASLFFLLSLFTFFIQYVHLLTSPSVLVERPFGDQFFRDVWGVAGVLLPAALSAGVILFAMRRWDLPVGSLVFVLGSNTVLMFILRYVDSGAYPQLLVAGLAASVVVEGLRLWLKPAAERPTALRLFAFLMPALYFGALFLSLLMTDGMWWAIHMWAGVPVLAGVAGLFLSYLAFPPAIPD